MTMVRTCDSCEQPVPENHLRVTVSACRSLTGNRPPGVELDLCSNACLAVWASAKVGT
ncbi:hypothetical protein SEA_BIGGITYBASS_65 [Gordonia phage BiggityBass]|nr:hypothetical protein SEA_BIGGITYBASS_65 [Gordonia phage BiggityBass]